jgi:hypothetical protein
MIVVATVEVTTGVEVAATTVAAVVGMAAAAAAAAVRTAVAVVVVGTAAAAGTAEVGTAAVAVAVGIAAVEAMMIEEAVVAVTTGVQDATMAGVQTMPPKVELLISLVSTVPKKIESIAHFSSRLGHVGMVTDAAACTIGRCSHRRC